MKFSDLKIELLKYIELNDFQKAIETANKIINLKELKSNQLKFAYRKLCVISNRKSEYKRTEEWAAKGLDFESDNPFFHNQFLMSKVRLKKWGEALVQADSMLEKDPNNQNTLLQKGKILTYQNKINEAKKWFAKLENTEENNLEVDKILAEKFLNENDWDQALEQYKTLVEKYPEKLTVYIELSKVYADFNLKNEAKKILLFALEKFGHSTELDLRIGEFLLLLGEQNIGISYLKKVYEEAPKSNLAYKISHHLLETNNKEAKDYIIQITNPSKRKIAEAQLAKNEKNNNNELKILAQGTEEDKTDIDICIAYLTALLESHHMEEFWNQYPNLKNRFENNPKMENLVLRALNIEGRYEEAIDIYERLNKELPQKKYNLSIANNLVKLGKTKEAQILLLELSKEPFILEEESYNELCINAFLNAEMISWESIIDNLLKRDLQKKDIARFIAFYEKNNAHKIATLFLKNILQKEKINDTNYIKYLMLRIEAKSILSSSDKSNGAENIKQFLISNNFAGSKITKENYVLDTFLNPFNAIKLAEIIVNKLGTKDGFALYRFKNQNETIDSSKKIEIDCLGLWDEMAETMQSFHTSKSETKDLKTEQTQSNKNQFFVSSNICLDLDYWGLFDYIFSKVESCSIVSSSFFIEEYIRQQFLVEINQVLIVNSASPFALENDNDIELSKIELIKPGELVLIDANVNTLDFCLKVKRLGGIAIDIGNLANNWVAVNKKVISFFNPRFLSASKELSLHV